MGGLRKFLAVLGALALIASGFLVWGPTSPAGADHTAVTLGTFPPELGVLRLHLQNDGQSLRWEPASDDAVQHNLTASNCKVQNPQAPFATLGFAPSGGQNSLGLFDNGLGVFVRGESGAGQPCGRIDGTTQWISTKLTGTLAGKVMDFAELDLEFKFGAKALVELYRSGGTSPLASFTYALSGPDSGPDSADGDNKRVRVPPAGSPLTLFDEIRIKVDPSTPGGGLSLEAGADGTPALAGGLGERLKTLDSVFHVVAVDGTLACGSETPTEGGGSVPSASVTLLNEAGCQPVPYSLDTSTVNGGQLISFQKPDTAHNMYRATFTWTIEESAYPVPVTEIDYPDDELGPRTPEFCDGTFESPSLPNDYDQSWCVVKQEAVSVGEGQMRVTETFLGTRDPFYLR